MRRTVLLMTVLSIVGGCSSAPAGASGPPPSGGGSMSAAPSPTATAAATTAHRVPAPGEPWIAYQRVTNRAEAALMRPDGSDAYTPTGSVPGTDQSNPDWSPDGLRLVFAVTIDDRDHLWTVDADGSGAKELVDCEAPCLFVDDPAWSPDGASVLYSRNEEVDGKSVATLETVRLADGHIDVLLTAAPVDFFAGARWSPDGRSIVLEVVHRAGTSPESELSGVTLSVVDLSTATRKPRGITDPALFAATADWSGDGTEIVYSALPVAKAPQPDLFTIRPDGTGLRRLTTLADTGGYAAEPDFDPNGDRILFSGQLEGGRAGILAAVPRAGGTPVSATGSMVIEGRHPRSRPTP